MFPGLLGGAGVCIHRSAGDDRFRFPGARQLARSCSSSLVMMVAGPGSRSLDVVGYIPLARGGQGGGSTGAGDASAALR
jgi:hypothetical protein